MLLTGFIGYSVVVAKSAGCLQLDVLGFGSASERPRRSLSSFWRQAADLMMSSVNLKKFTELDDGAAESPSKGGTVCRSDGVA